MRQWVWAIGLLERHLFSDSLRSIGLPGQYGAYCVSHILLRHFDSRSIPGHEGPHLCSAPPKVGLPGERFNFRPSVEGCQALSNHHNSCTHVVSRPAAPAYQALAHHHTLGYPNIYLWYLSFDEASVCSHPRFGKPIPCSHATESRIAPPTIGYSSCKPADCLPVWCDG